MRFVEFSESSAEPIALFQSLSASSLPVAHGSGEVHVYFLRFAPGGEVGVHVTALCQLFVAITGSGWAAGADGQRFTLGPGQGVFFERGETHSKGSEHGMLALMVQSSEFALVTPAGSSHSPATNGT